MQLVSAYAVAATHTVVAIGMVSLRVVNLVSRERERLRTVAILT